LNREEREFTRTSEFFETLFVDFAATRRSRSRLSHCSAARFGGNGALPKSCAMKTLFCFLVAGLVSAFAADAAKPMPAVEARQHIGEVAVVTGRVDSVRKFDSGMQLMNLDGRYPHQALTVVVSAKAAASVGDVSGYKGKTIAVSGRITEYKGGPQIEVSSKDAIKEVAAAK
jgi:hypothetical protein